jgi:HSP20 family molecular chaperone IbpA
MIWNTFLDNIAAKHGLTRYEQQTLLSWLPTEYEEKNTKTVAYKLFTADSTIHGRFQKIYDKFEKSYPELSLRSGRRNKLRLILLEEYRNERGKFKENIQNEDGEIYLKVERSIEFLPEYWEAGTSILSYFSRILNVKYPSKKIKVRIEQEGLTLRMIIDTPNGEKEEIEKTLDEYGMVIAGKMEPENFLSDPFQVMALKQKLEIANLEFRQTKNLLDFTRDNSQQRIESLEVQVNKLHSIIEKGLQSGNHVFGVISKMTEQDKSNYNLSNAKFGGGFAAEGGFQVGGNLIDLSSANNLTDAAQEIQELLQQLQGQGVSMEDAKQQAASDLAKQAKDNKNVMGKLVTWGQSLADTAGKTTVSEVAKGVVKMSLQMLGIPLP